MKGNINICGELKWQEQETISDSCGDDDTDNSWIPEYIRAIQERKQVPRIYAAPLIFFCNNSLT
jgi:hypothetical protein